MALTLGEMWNSDDGLNQLLKDETPRYFAWQLEEIHREPSQVKGSFTNFFSPVRAHLFVAQKTHLERTGRYFQVDQMPNR